MLGQKSLMGAKCFKGVHPLSHLEESQKGKCNVLCEHFKTAILLFYMHAL